MSTINPTQQCGDAVQTANNIVAPERLFRISIVIHLITFASLWLLVKDVNVQRWQERASAAGDPK